jgi:hypothetical protein
MIEDVIVVGDRHAGGEEVADGPDDIGRLEVPSRVIVLANHKDPRVVALRYCEPTTHRRA